MSSTGYAQTKSALNLGRGRVTPARRIGLKKEMKLTWKQRLANWLTSSSNDDNYLKPAPHEVETINSNGMRFSLHKANGGFVIETRLYDERNDRNINKLYIVTENQDLGEELGKIITMESLR